MFRRDGERKLAAVQHGNARVQRRRDRIDSYVAIELVRDRSQNRECDIKWWGRGNINDKECQVQISESGQIHEVWKWPLKPRRQRLSVLLSTIYVPIYAQSKTTCQSYSGADDWSSNVIYRKDSLVASNDGEFIHSHHRELLNLDPNQRLVSYISKLLICGFGVGCGKWWLSCCLVNLLTKLVIIIISYCCCQSWQIESPEPP